MKTLKMTLAALALAAANPAGASSLDETDSRFEAAFSAGNASALATLYTDDAVVVSPSQEIVKARPEIRDFWADKMRSGTSRFRVHAINTREDGDSACQTAVWSATVISNGHASELYGEMTSLYQRQPDGRWMIRVQNWN